MTENIHISVLLAESLAGLALKPGASCIDGTLGGAGHAEAILHATAPDGLLLGLDADPAAVARGAERLAPFGARATLRQASFRTLEPVARATGFSSVNGVLLDLGLSSFQLEEAGRGFSFLLPGPLDMRFDPASGLTAAEVVNLWDLDKLADTIFRYGEEPRSRRIARAIVSARPVHTTDELARIVLRSAGYSAGSRGRHGARSHPATRVFQALRIAVNDELGVLESVLPQAVSLLAPGGRLAVIAFHSLEDRIVKRFFQREERDCICEPDPHYLGPPETQPCTCGHHATLRLVTRKPMTPGEGELAKNPRSRSAKLRVAERLPAHS